MENIAYTEVRALLERILTQTDPVNNTAVILLVHKSESPKDNNPVFNYQSKATIDLLISKRIIRILNRPGDKERTPDRWKYKAILYRDKSEQLLRSLGKQITQAKPRTRKRPTIDQHQTLSYLGKSYSFRDNLSKRFRLVELLCNRFEDCVDKETVYCTLTGLNKLQYHDLLGKQGSIKTHEIIKTTRKGLCNEVFKRKQINLNIVVCNGGIKLVTANKASR